MTRTILLCFGFLALAACSGDDTAEQYIARANDALVTSEYKAATIELKNALRLEPNSAQARWLLGKVYLETGDMASAEKELERALSLGWAGEELKPALARALLAQGEYSRVRDISTEGLSPAVTAQLRALQAQAALGLGDSWDAEELIEQALGTNPDSTEALLAKARLLASRNELEAASAALDRAIELDPGLAGAWSLRGDILVAQKDFDGALAAYDQTVNLRDNNFGDLFKRAVLNLQLGNIEASQADATAMLAKAPQHPAANYVQGVLHYQAGRYGEAITALSAAEPAFEQYPLALFFLASAQLVEGKLDQAGGLAERYHKLAPNSIQGRKLLATIRLQQGKNTDVRSLLQPVLEASPEDVGALNLMANALIREGKTNEGIELLSRVATLQPDSPVAQVRLGAGLLMGGQGDAAEQHMETALELNPEFQQADILLVLNHMQKGDFPAAIAAAQAYQRRHLTSVTPYNLLGKVYQQAGQPEEARAAFQRALTLDAADPAANHNLAEMALADNDLVAARAYYEAVLAGHEDSVASLVQLARLDAREGNEEKLVAHLEQAMTVGPAVLEPRLLLARFYLGKGQPEKVAPLFTSLEPRQQQGPDVLRLLAMAQLSSRDASGAQFTLEQLLESSPDSAPIRHMMAMAVAGAGDSERAKQELERAVALDENYVPSRIALAKMALINRSGPEFDAQLEKLVALAPESYEVLLLQAAAQQGKGDKKAALVFAERAFDIAPSTATLVALGSYQEAAGDRKGAILRFDQWLKEHPEDMGTRMALANSLQLNQQYDEAGEQYSTVLQATPDNPIALNNQAWIIRNQNPAQALEYARKAAELAPDSAEVLDTLAVVEYINKDYSLARRSIGRALNLSPDNPSMLYHSAMIAAALDEKAAARATLEKLLATASDFPEIDEAKALLAQLGN